MFWSGVNGAFAKCNIHVWKAEMNVIPTWEALKRRNLRVLDNVCVMCELRKESTDHITTGCLMAMVVWDHINRWCKIPLIYGFSVRDLLELHKNIRLGKIEKEVLHWIIIIGCWRICICEKWYGVRRQGCQSRRDYRRYLSLVFLWLKNDRNIEP